MTLKTRAHRAARQRRCVLIAGATQRWVFSPRPACGERSKPQASGEGAIEESECVEIPPHLRPSPRKRGEGEVERGENVEVYISVVPAYAGTHTPRR